MWSGLSSLGPAPSQSADTLPPSPLNDPNKLERVHIKSGVTAALFRFDSGAALNIFHHLLGLASEVLTL